MTARPMTEWERARLAAKLRVTTEQMARRCSVDQVLWNMHSNACLEAADALLSTSAAVRGMREALQLFRDHYPRGINPWLDEAHSKARAALSGIEGEDEQATRGEDAATAPTDR